MNSFKTMYVTELKLNLRHLDLPIFGMLFPVLVALLLGFLNPQQTSLGETFAAASTIGIAANGLMGLPLTLCDYRAKKILKQLEVTPIRKQTVLFVHFLLKVSLATFSATLVYLSLKIFLNYHFTGHLLYFFCLYLLIVLVIFGIGMMIASIAPNMQVATVLTTLVYFPTLFLSGATIPQAIMPRGFTQFLTFLPLTQGIQLLKNAALNLSSDHTFFSLLYLFLISVIAISISIKYFKWE